MMILVIILAKVIGKARDRGKKTVCLSNNRQIGVAISLYAADNSMYVPPRAVDGTYSDPTLWPGPANYPATKGALWSDQNILGQYAGSTNGNNGAPAYFNRMVKPHSPFICPADQSHKLDDQGNIYGSYGMGANFTWAAYNDSAKYGYANMWMLTKVASPGREFVLTDCADGTINGGAYAEPFPMYGTEDTVPNR